MNIRLKVVGFSPLYRH